MAMQVQPFTYCQIRPTKHRQFPRRRGKSCWVGVMEIIMWVCAICGGIMVLDNNWNAAIAFGVGAIFFHLVQA